MSIGVISSMLMKLDVVYIDYMLKNGVFLSVVYYVVLLIVLMMFVIILVRIIECRKYSFLSEKCMCCMS